VHELRDVGALAKEGHGVEDPQLPRSLHQCRFERLVVEPCVGREELRFSDEDQSRLRMPAPNQRECFDRVDLALPRRQLSDDAQR
jgi:hypothetical protein